MERLMTIEYANAYGVTLSEARRFTDEEKASRAEWYRDYGLIGIADGRRIDLDGLTWRDMPDRPADGAFPGCKNRAWIITAEEWDRYIALNAHRLEERAIKEETDEIVMLTRRLEEMERQGTLCKDRAEARRKEKEWNDLYNEGGDGYVPHYYTQAEHDNTVERLAYLTGRRKG